MTRIDSHFDQLQEALILSKIDLRFDDDQLRIKESDISRIVFRIGYGDFELLVILFSLANTRQYL